MFENNNTDNDTPVLDTLLRQLASASKNKRVSTEARGEEQVKAGMQNLAAKLRKTADMMEAGDVESAFCVVIERTGATFHCGVGESDTAKLVGYVEAYKSLITQRVLSKAEDNA